MSRASIWVVPEPGCMWVVHMSGYNLWEEERAIGVLFDMTLRRDGGPSETENDAVTLIRLGE